MSTFIHKTVDEIFNSERGKPILVGQSEDFKERFLKFLKEKRTLLLCIGFREEFITHYGSHEIMNELREINKNHHYDLNYVISEIYFSWQQDKNKKDPYYRPIPELPLESTRRQMYDSSPVDKSELMFF